jgi:hypothetical protein
MKEKKAVPQIPELIIDNPHRSKNVAKLAWNFPLLNFSKHTLRIVAAVENIGLIAFFPTQRKHTPSIVFRLILRNLLSK